MRSSAHGIFHSSQYHTAQPRRVHQQRAVLHCGAAGLSSICPGFFIHPPADRRLGYTSRVWLLWIKLFAMLPSLGGREPSQTQKACPCAQLHRRRQASLAMGCSGSIMAHGALSPVTAARGSEEPRAWPHCQVSIVSQSRHNLVVTHDRE